MPLVDYSRGQRHIYLDGLSVPCHNQSIEGQGRGKSLEGPQTILIPEEAEITMTTQENLVSTKEFSKNSNGRKRRLLSRRLDEHPHHDRRPQASARGRALKRKRIIVM